MIFPLLNPHLITYIVLEKSSLIVHFENGEYLRIYENICILIDILKDKGFVRVNQNYIINKQYIEGLIIINRKKYLVIRNTNIKISRRKRYIFK